MYARVEASLVTEVRSRLPQAWRFADGRSCGNFDLLDPAEQRSAGWYPLVENTPAFDSALQRVAGFADSIEAAQVTRNFLIEDIPLAELKATKIAEVRAKRDSLIDEGSFTVQTVAFARDDSAKANAAFFGAMIANGKTVSQVPVKRSDESYVLLSLVQFGAYAQALHDSIRDVWVASINHESAIRALTSRTDVAAYDTTTGWPA